MSSFVRVKAHQEGCERPKASDRRKGGEGKRVARHDDRHRLEDLPVPALGPGRPPHPQPAHGDRDADHDARGEVAPDLGEPARAEVEVEEERGVQPLEEVVDGAERALERAAERVEAVRADGGQGEQRDGVDAVPGVRQAE